MDRITCPECLNELDEDIDVCPFCGYPFSENKGDKEEATPEDWEDVARDERRAIVRRFLVRAAVWVGATALVWLFLSFRTESLPTALLFGVVIFSTYIWIEPAIGLGQKIKAVQTTTDTGTNQVIRKEQVNFGWVGAVIGVALVYGVLFFLSKLFVTLPSYVIADEVAMAIVLLIVPLHRILVDIQGIVTWSKVISSAKKQSDSLVDTVTEGVYTKREKACARFNLRALLTVVAAFAVLVAAQAIQVWIFSGVSKSSYDAAVILRAAASKGDQTNPLLALVDPAQLPEPTESTFTCYNSGCEETYTTEVHTSGISYRVRFSVSGRYDILKGWSGDVTVTECKVTQVAIQEDIAFEGDAVWYVDSQHKKPCYAKLIVHNASSETGKVSGEVTVWENNRQVVILADTVSGRVFLKDGGNGDAVMELQLDSADSPVIGNNEPALTVTLSNQSLLLFVKGCVDGTLHHRQP